MDKNKHYIILKNGVQLEITEIETNGCMKAIDALTKRNVEGKLWFKLGNRMIVNYNEVAAIV